MSRPLAFPDALMKEDVFAKVFCIDKAEFAFRFDKLNASQATTLNSKRRKFGRLRHGRRLGKQTRNGWEAGSQRTNLTRVKELGEHQSIELSKDRRRGEAGGSTLPRYGQRRFRCRRGRHASHRFRFRLPVDQHPNRRVPRSDASGLGFASAIVRDGFSARQRKRPLAFRIPPVPARHAGPRPGPIEVRQSVPCRRSSPAVAPCPNSTASAVLSVAVGADDSKPSQSHRRRRDALRGRPIGQTWDYQASSTLRASFLPRNGSSIEPQKQRQLVRLRIGQVDSQNHSRTLEAITGPMTKNLGLLGVSVRTTRPRKEERGKRKEETWVTI